MINKTKPLNETDKLNDQNTSLKKYKSKYLLRKRSYFTVIITLTVLIIGIMGYSYYVGKHMATVYTPLIDVTMEIKLESTIAHLKFEEILSGDRNRDMEQVEKHIEQADWYAEAILQGGENPEGKFIPLKNDLLRKEIKEVRNKIAKFKNIMDERYTNMLTAKVDKDAYERYHEIFWDLFTQIDKVETELQKIIVKKESLFSKIQYSLIFTVLIFSFILIIVFNRFEKYRLQNYLATIKINKNLELEIIKRKQAEKKLKATNQQLIASEQQLRASNQQLTASEQQLRASNQQLTASEQQLKASNQQLIADEEKLRDSEYQLKESQEVAGLGSYVLDISSDIWKSSSILDNIFGLDKKYNKDISGWLQIVHPEDKAMMQDYFATNVLIKHEPFDKEYRIKRINDQQERWVHGMGKLEFNDDGDPIIMIGTVQDITERKQVEEKLISRNKELELFNEVTVGRELKMIELKKEINELLEKSGKKPKYEIPA